MSVAAKQTFLMMGLMEPPPEMEGEFHDWYDGEHLPGRLAVPGFLTGHRLVCLEGWPRYVAMYDLESLDVLKSEPYLAIAGKNASPWARRIIGRVHGYSRNLMRQLYPGAGLFGAQGEPARVLLLRFKTPGEAAAQEILPGLEMLFGGRPETAQFRLFRAEVGDANYAAIVELRRPIEMATLDLARLGSAARTLEIINMYHPYFRRQSTPPSMAG